MTKDEAFQIINEHYENFSPVLLASILTEDDEGTIEKEYEQRFELKELPEVDFNDQSEIKQGLLFDKPGFTMRIREEKPKSGDAEYSITCKFYKKSDEAEAPITKEMFDKLWPEIISGTNMKKTRYFYKNWVVDDIRSPEKKIVAEIETETEDEDIELPSEFIEK